MLYRTFKWILKIEPKKIKVLIININPQNILNINFEDFDWFMNES